MERNSQEVYIIDGENTGPVKRSASQTDINPKRQRTSGSIDSAQNQEDSTENDYVTRREFDNCFKRISKIEERLARIEKTFENLKCAFLGGNAPSRSTPSPSSVTNANSSETNKTQQSVQKAPKVSSNQTQSGQGGAPSGAKSDKAPTLASAAQPAQGTPPSASIMPQVTVTPTAKNIPGTTSAAAKSAAGTPSAAARPVQGITTSATRTSQAGPSSANRQAQTTPSSAKGPAQTTPSSATRVQTTPSSATRVQTTPSSATRVQTTPSARSGTGLQFSAAGSVQATPSVGASSSTASSSSSCPSNLAQARSPPQTFASTSTARKNLLPTDFGDISIIESIDNNAGTSRARISIKPVSELSAAPPDDSVSKRVPSYGQRRSAPPVAPSSGLHQRPTQNSSTTLSTLPAASTSINESGSDSSATEIPEAAFRLIRPKQEIYDEEYNSSTIETPLKNQLVVYIDGDCRKKKNHNVYAAVAGYQLSSGEHVVCQPFVSDLKRPYHPQPIYANRKMVELVRQQAEVSAAFSVMQFLNRSRQSGNTSVKIVARTVKLVQIMRNGPHTVYPSLDTCQCKKFPCKHPMKWQTLDTFADQLSDDLPRLVLALMNTSIRVEWSTYTYNPQDPEERKIAEQFKAAFKKHIQVLLQQTNSRNSIS